MLRKLGKALVVLFLGLFIVAIGMDLYGRHGPASSRSQPLEVWLATFKSLEVPARCQQFPLRERYAGRTEECREHAARLFDACASGPDSVDLPSRVRSRAHAVRLAGRVGRCLDTLSRPGHLQPDLRRE